MRVWSIIWRFLWVAAASSVVVDAVRSIFLGGDILIEILGFCFACIVVNLPLYICGWVQREEGERQMTLFRWDVAPVRTLIADILLAPIATVYSIVALTIQAFMLIFDA
jgi:hypothetical protein